MKTFIHRKHFIQTILFTFKKIILQQIFFWRPLFFPPFPSLFQKRGKVRSNITVNHCTIFTNAGVVPLASWGQFIRGSPTTGAVIKPGWASAQTGGSGSRRRRCDFFRLGDGGQEGAV